MCELLLAGVAYGVERLGRVLQGGLFLQQTLHIRTGVRGGVPAFHIRAGDAPVSEGRGRVRVCGAARGADGLRAAVRLLLHERGRELLHR